MFKIGDKVVIDPDYYDRMSTEGIRYFHSLGQRDLIGTITGDDYRNNSSCLVNLNTYTGFGHAGMPDVNTVPKKYLKKLGNPYANIKDVKL